MAILRIILVLCSIALANSSNLYSPYDPSSHVCYLPKKAGPCYANFRRYYYNKSTRKCEKFTYGGCLGNANNFETLEKCMAACPLVCSLPKVVGPCKGSIPRYYYNEDSGKCELFNYGGCKGNPNNFRSLVMCRDQCEETSGPTCPPLKPGHGGICIESCSSDKDCSPNERCCSNGCGHVCKKSYYPDCPNGEPAFCIINICHVAKCPSLPDAKCIGKCNGCFEYWEDKDGNDVTDKCKERVCSLPKVVGPCEAAIPRYFHNKETGKCESFLYGGCHGNSNNFETLEECRATCPSVCSLPKVAGPCKGSIPRYYYNEDSGKCELFYYGGCKGNQNNFKSLVMCRDQCEETSGPTCPPLKPGHGGICIESCSSDKDCSPNEKCCSNGCGHVCKKSYYPDCPNGEPAFCIIHACHIAKCPSLPGAKCIGKCNGCFEYWEDKDGNDVTDKCKKQVLEPDPSCPAVKKTGGICELECHSNDDCKGDRVCCSNGCGAQCQDKPDTCSQPMYAGPCRGMIPRYYFDQTTGSCKLFVYGGCKGNDNNFKTLQQCEKRCSGASEKICPPLPPGTIGHCAEMCFDCTAGQLCCSNGCGHVCKTAVYPECVNARCPSQLEAECRATCKGCSPRFFDRFGNDVTKQCQCPGRIFEADCSGDKNPCNDATCPGQVNVQCRTNSCGKCKAIFYDNSGKEVECKKLPVLDPSCPPFPLGHGICGQECDANEDCKGGKICCSNGCGTHCRDPIPDERCPPPDPRILESLPFILCPTSGCRSYSDCKGADICCFNGCSKQCRRIPKYDDSCPAVLREVGKQCPHYCTANDECRSDYMCCLTSCGAECKPREDVCPPGVPVRLCFHEQPCAFATCPNHQKATCRVNNCGKCEAEFYDEQNRRITDCLSFP